MEGLGVDDEQGEVAVYADAAEDDAHYADARDDADAVVPGAGNGTSECVVYDDTVCDVDVDCHGEDGAHGLLRCIMDAVVVGADALVVDAHAARTRVPLRMVLLMLR